MMNEAKPKVPVIVWIVWWFVLIGAAYAGAPLIDNAEVAARVEKIASGAGAVSAALFFLYLIIVLYEFA